MLAGWYCCLVAGFAWETRRTKSSLIVSSDELEVESVEEAAEGSEESNEVDVEFPDRQTPGLLCHGRSARSALACLFRTPPLA